MNQQDLLASTQIIAFNPILAETDAVRTQYFAYLRTLVNRAKWDNRKYTKAQLVFYKEKLCNGRKNIYFRARKAAFDPRFCYLLPFDLAVMTGFNAKLLRSAKGTALLNKIASDFSLPKDAKRILSCAIDAALGNESAWQNVLRSAPMQDFGEYLQIVKGNSAFLRKQPFKILITATMSAGKSTLINALVGKNISLMQNMACTSKIHTIVAKPYEDGATSEDDHALVLNASKEDLMNDNDSNLSSNITVGSYFGGGLGGERIVLLDSPGVNSSENKDHTEITQTMLRSKKYRMVLYVLNATTLGTRDEEAHLETVKQYIGRTKVIFVMNKIDDMVSEDDDLFNAIESQKEFLEKKGFRKPIICPVSARAAYLVKKSQQEPLSRLERNDMERYMDKFEKLSLAAYYEKQLECTPITDCASEEQTLYRNCGFAYFEQLILALEKGEGLRVMSTRVSMEHDAQRQETAIAVDGADLPRESRLCQAASGRPLKAWADEFPALLCEELETEDFTLEFRGTAPDWDILKASFKRAQKNGIVKLAGLRYNKPRAEKNNRKSPAAAPQAPRNVPTLNVYMIATMSSGKSTLINAMLGQKLMPSKNEACTATITEIIDVDGEGFSAVVYDENGNVIEEVEHLTYDEMNRLNEEAVHRISAQGDIPFVDSRSTALRLVDIPSSNFYNEASIKAAYRAIGEIHLDENSMVLYVLNGTQLSINDDAYMLRYLADKIKEGGKQARDRFLFVINKMDNFDPEEEDIQKAVDAARNYLA
ncbi:MAG: dynamin family protein, partial [Clostridiales bacterium]|nr:dynamin family protein [Clostridiales bacterium]